MCVEVTAAAVCVPDMSVTSVGIIRYFCLCSDDLAVSYIGCFVGMRFPKQVVVTSI